MKSHAVSLRIPDDVRATIEEAAQHTGRPFSAVANEMLAEAARMRRISGIAFADGPDGRVVRVAGTGLEVWEIVGTYQALGEDRARLQQSYHWLSEQQLQAALAYAEAYPDEIAARLAREDQWTPETVWSTYPATRPQGR